MRIVPFLLSAVLFTTVPGLCSNESTQLTLQEGTPVKLKLEEGLSTKTSSAGQKVQLVVLEDVLGKDDKTVLIKEGSPAVAYLSNIDEKDGAKGGKLTLEITSVRAIDGTRVALRGIKAKSGHDGAGVGSYVVGGVCLGLIGLGVVALAKQASHARMSAGTVVTAFVDHDTALASTTPSTEQPNKQIVVNTTVSNSGTGNLESVQQSGR